MDLEKSISPQIDQCIENAIEKEMIPGAVLLVSVANNIVHNKAYGMAQKLPFQVPSHLDTIYDLSSLTKVFATTAAVMNLVESNKINLETPVSQYIPDFKAIGIGRQEKMSISDLLIHGAGFPAWRPLYKEIYELASQKRGPLPCSSFARKAIMEATKQTPLVQKVGAGAIYSDLGFILLTEVIERITKSRLDEFCEQHIFKYLKLQDTFFVPLNDKFLPIQSYPGKNFAATEFHSQSNKYLLGTVHDENARAMGGVSGHAGLFSTAYDLYQYSSMLLRAFHGERGLIVSPETIREFWRRRVFSNETVRAYGWDVPSRIDSSSGKYFSDLTFGHLGFTGTSIWIDAAREVIVILLTNRVHPTHENEKIKILRPELHDLVMETLLTNQLSTKYNPVNVSFSEEDEWTPDLVSLTGSGQETATPRWILTTYSKGEPGAKLPAPPREPLQAVWSKCQNCRSILYRPELEKNLNVCPNCDYHHYLPCLKRIEMIADTDSFQEKGMSLSPKDPLTFFDSKNYSERLTSTQKKLGVSDAFRYGSCTLGGKPIHIGVFDFSFMGGSMGSVVGEKVTRVFEDALNNNTGAIIVSASGGARMQEGVLSLMQMAKSCAALSKLKQAGLPYISIMCHPTTGGVAASFSMLGDINIAEPNALIGFAGPRVIEQTIRQKLPEGFQRAEYLLEHGMIDMIVPRKNLKKTLSSIYSMLRD